MVESPLRINNMITRELLEVVDVSIPAPQYVSLKLDTGKSMQGLIPGMFYELRAPSQEGRLFKPISILDVEDSYVSFLIKVVGAGTRAFTQVKAGDRIEALGPLGNGFPSIEGRRVLLVSGGAGYPPLAWLKRESDHAKFCLHLHGCAIADEVFSCDLIYTADGSQGHKGLVTDSVGSLISEHDIDLVLSCGPIPMLAKMTSICMQVEHYVSMEAYMACGVGVCHGCAIPVDQSYKLVCKDGPVFDATRIRWSEL
jgi:dihydroorotate dehydrogenase electron transfer subunit